MEERYLISYNKEKAEDVRKTLTELGYSIVKEFRYTSGMLVIKNRHPNDLEDNYIETNNKENFEELGKLENILSVEVEGEYKKINGKTYSPL